MDKNKCPISPSDAISFPGFIGKYLNLAIKGPIKWAFQNVGHFLISHSFLNSREKPLFEGFSDDYCQGSPPS